eukprot:CFRG4553T1
MAPRPHNLVSGREPVQVDSSPVSRSPLRGMMRRVPSNASDVSSSSRRSSIRTSSIGRKDSLNPSHMSRTYSRESVGNTAEVNVRVANVDGQTAASYVAYALSDINFVYPSAPAGYLGSEIEEWNSSDVKNAYGHVGKQSKLQVKAGAGLVLHGALSVGELGTAYAGSDAIKYLLPTIHYLAANQRSTVMHIATRHIDDNLVVHLDHSQVMAARNTGAVILSSHSVQEAHDISVISHILTLRTKTPVIHMIDGANTSSESSRARLLQYGEINALMNKYGDVEKYRDENNSARHQPLHQDGKRRSPDTTAQIAEDVMRECSDVLGVRYSPFEYVGARDADVVVVLMGYPSQVFLETSRLLRSVGARVGVLKIRVYRPWSARDFVSALPLSVKKVVVMDFTSPNASSHDPGALFLDVLATVESQIYGSKKPRVIQGKVSVKKFTPAMAKAVFDFAGSEQRQSSFTIGFGAGVSAAKPSPTSSYRHNFELEIGENVNTVPEHVSEVLVWQKEDDSLLAPTKSLFSTLCDGSETYVQTQTSYDAYKNGGVSTTHVRMSPSPINAPYPIGEANLAVVTNASLLYSYDVVASIRQGGVLVINTSAESVDEESDKLSLAFKKEVLAKEISVYTIDLDKVSVDSGLGSDTNGEGKAVALLSAIVRLGGLASYETTLQDLRICLEEKALDGELLECQLQIIETVSDTGLTVQSIPESWGAESTAVEGLTAEEAEVEEEVLPTAVMGNILPAHSFEAKSDKSHTFDKWHKAAWATMFPKAYNVREDLRPAEHTSYVVTVSENRRLTPDDYERNVFHMEMDITGTGLKYQIGDALGVFGHNGDEELEDFIEFYGLNGDDVVGVYREPHHAKGEEIDAAHAHSCVENRTVWQWLQQVTDLFGRPTKGFYEALAHYATKDDEKAELLRICGDDGKAEFKKRVEETITFADILKEFPSAHPPVEELILLIPAIKPRHYSIASSQRMHENSVHLLVVVHDWITPSKCLRVGQCTRYLVGVKPGAKMTVCVKPSVMILPPSHTQPCIMSGLGTGMAPFRAFIQERAMAKMAGEEVGPMILYFGSRSRGQEYLYGEELEAYHADGLLSGLRLAFSRDQPHKIYIQHKMMEDKEYLNEYLNNGDGHFYLCGPTWPAGDVRDAIVGSFVEAGGMTEGDATVTLQRLKDDERYILEVY